MATTFYEVPLSGVPQTFTISIAGVSYQLTLTYQNVDEGGWSIEIADTAGNDIVSGIPLVTGADLLGQYEYIGLGCGMFVYTDGDNDAVPTFDNLGSTSHLIVAITT